MVDIGKIDENAGSATILGIAPIVGKVKAVTAIHDVRTIKAAEALVTQAASQRVVEAGGPDRIDIDKGVGIAPWVDCRAASCSGGRESDGDAAAATHAFRQMIGELVKPAAAIDEVDPAMRIPHLAVRSITGHRVSKVGSVDTINVRHGIRVAIGVDDRSRLEIRNDALRAAGVEFGHVVECDPDLVRRCAIAWCFTIQRVISSAANEVILVAPIERIITGKAVDRVGNRRS